MLGQAKKALEAASQLGSKQLLDQAHRKTCWLGSQLDAN